MREAEVCMPKDLADVHTSFVALVVASVSSSLGSRQSLKDAKTCNLRYPVNVMFYLAVRVALDSDPSEMPCLEWPCCGCW